MEDACHTPQCLRIFSLTSLCSGSLKATTIIWPPHCGQEIGSQAYTRLISMAQVALLRQVPFLFAPSTLHAVSVAAEAAFARSPQLLFE